MHLLQNTQITNANQYEKGPDFTAKHHSSSTVIITSSTVKQLTVIWTAKGKKNKNDLVQICSLFFGRLCCFSIQALGFCLCK
jgi:hypothetical protein